MKKKMCVLGAGESGVGAALLGIKEGFEVFVSDYSKILGRYKDILNANQISWEEKQHTEMEILTADWVIKSPGIPKEAEIVKKIIERGIPILSEIEFASRFTSAKLIAVTGSNGKTTVVNWIDFVLNNAAIDHVLAGNVGNSFALEVSKREPEYFVLEVSSFQLDDIQEFHPKIAVLTNLTRDHLDRYDYDFEKYIDAKFRITENQTEEDYFIYDADDQVIAEQLNKREIKAKKIPFSLSEIQGWGTEIRNHKIRTTLKDREFSTVLEGVGLKGEHNAKNAMAASTVANILKIRKQTIRESLESFQGVEHRLEKVAKIRNVEYINDSKATNINSTYYALKTVRPKTVWIVGGVDKGNDYTELLPLVNEKIKAIVCLGIDNQKIINSFDRCIETVVEARSMKEAVNMAYHLAESGDTVLLSPACASFDLFENYEDRGRQFKQAVSEL